MNSHSKLHRIFLSATAALLVLAGSPLFGQGAPAPSGSTAQTQQTPVKLDPFQVSADSDVGFVAASALAGARLATALKDTPVAYSVLTSEFLEAFNTTDVVQAAEFGVNTTVIDGDGSQRNFARPAAAQVYVRGVKITRPQRNFFWFNYTADSYNIDRVDLARGPNSVLFGAGTAGGTVNTVTKKALTSRKVRELRLQAASFGHIRTTVDVNEPVNDKFAVRVNAMLDKGDTWRDHEWTKKHGAHLAATYNLTPNLTISGDLEIGSHEEKKWTIMQDQISGWDGVTTNANKPASLSTTFQRAHGLTIRSTRRWVWNPRSEP
mgnify:CR=1 FL=1